MDANINHPSNVANVLNVTNTFVTFNTFATFSNKLDYNGDGGPDMMASSMGMFRLYRNRVPTNNGHVYINLRSTSANKLAIGARVEVYAGGKKYMQEVNAGRGVKMQRPATLLFGIGTATQVDSVKVRWPGKTSWETFPQLGRNGYYHLEEGGQIRTGMGKDKTPGDRGLKVYPNPATGSINLQLPGYNGQAQVRIYNLTGAEVYRGSHRISETAVVSPGVLPGNYLVIVQAGGRQYTSQVTIR